MNLLKKFKYLWGRHTLQYHRILQKSIYYSVVLAGISFLPLVAHTQVNKELFTGFRVSYENHLSASFARSYQKENASIIVHNQDSNDFFNRKFAQLHYQHNVVHFISTVKLGYEAQTGITMQYNNASPLIIPISFGLIYSISNVYLPYIVPFISGGYSIWNIQLSEWSKPMAYWSTGVKISFGLFKSSLNYTLPDEYGLQDMGAIAKAYFAHPISGIRPQGPYLWYVWSLGVYFHL